MDGVTTLFTTFSSRLHHDMLHSLQELGIPLSNQQERTVEMLLAPLQDPFANLHTRYHQDKYIKDHLDYLVK